MAVALEAIAEGSVLVAILATILMIAAMVLIRGGVGIITDGIRNLSISGVHFGTPLADAIDGGLDDVINWLRHWLGVEVHFMGTLWHGIAWSIHESIDGIVDAYHTVAHAFDATITVVIPREIAALRRWTTGEIRLVRAYAESVEATLVHTATRLTHRIEAVADDIPVQIRHRIREFDAAVVRPLAHDLRVAERTIADVLRPGLARAEHELAAIRASVASGVATIEDALPALPHLGFDDIEALWQRIPWRSLAGLLTLGFLTHALLRALTREAGLDSAECRGKVKGICGADPRAWENLLAGLVGGIALTDFRELCDISRSIINEVESEFRQYTEQ